MSTSGSTGTPFISYQNFEKKKRVNAAVIHYSQKAGYRVGKNLIFLRAMTEESKKSTLKQWIQNENLIDISYLSNEDIKNILIEIKEISKKGSNTMILAYASTLDILKDYFLKFDTNIARKADVSGIVSSSEMLYDETREVLEEAFNCKVFSRYSNQENGIIGQDDHLNNNFILNQANYYVEVFKLDKDQLADKGEVGRIVVTDLFNYAMPMIRYDTGDIGSINYIKENGLKKKIINNFGGRKVDVVYNVDGHRLSPHSLTNNFWRFNKIKQYQFIQEGKSDYIVKINVGNNFNKEDELIKVLNRLLGSESNIKINYVDEIPVLSSGKRKYIVNKINNK